MINQILLYFVVLSTVATTVVSFVKNFDKFNRTEKLIYSYISISFVLWVAFNAIADIIKIYDIADFAARISLLFGVQVSTATFLLSSIFPQQVKRDKGTRLWERIVIVLTILLSILIIVTLYTPLNMISITLQQNAPLQFIPGILYSLVFAFSIIIFTFAFIRWYSRFYTYTALQREQIKLLSATLTLTILALIGGFIVLPAISPELSPYAILAHIFIALFLAQLQANILARNSIINFKIAIRSFLIFSTVLVLSFILFYTLKYLIQFGADGISIFLLFPILFMVVYRIYNSFQRRWVLVPAKMLVSDFSSKSVVLYRAVDITKLLISTLHKILPNAEIHIILKNKNSNLLTNLAKYAVSTTHDISVIGPEQLIEDLIVANQKGVSESEKAPIRFLLDDVMKQKINLLLLLSFKEEIEGVIVIKGGVLADNFVYSELKVLSQSASVALSRAKLYDEVTDFAKSLSKKVKERTFELGKARGLVEEKNKELSVALAELRSVDKAKSDFISMASHQLRTPISIARGYLSMLVEGDFGKLSKNQVPLLEKVLEGMKQLNNIVEDILNTSRIEQGRLVINYEETDVVQLVLSVIKELEKKAKDKGLILQKVNKLRTYPAQLDKNKLFEVFVNLVDNAIAYTPKGSITVAIRAFKSRVQVSVKDSGIGIPNGQRDQIFKRFSRLENAKKIRPDGSGIGLFTAKTIVDMHGGKIWFTSRIGHGTTFFVELPRYQKISKKEKQTKEIGTTTQTTTSS